MEDLDQKYQKSLQDVQNANHETLQVTEAQHQQLLSKIQNIHANALEQKDRDA